MAFVVEDGSGNANANSYASVAAFQSHHTDRGRSIGSYSTTAIETALVKATDYIDQRFGKRFRGVRQMKSQGLEWPRLDAFDNDGFLLGGEDDVPRQLIKATSEYALIVLKLIGGELLPNPVPPFSTIDEETGETIVNQSGQIMRHREKVGPLEEENWFQPISTQTTNVSVKSTLVDDLHIPEYPRADLWIEELLKSSMNMRLSRGD